MNYLKIEKKYRNNCLKASQALKFFGNSFLVICNFLGYDAQL